jgi:hypothetical protein
VVAFVLAVTVLTAAAVARERRDLIRIHAASADSLLAHLVEMPQFQADETAAKHEVELLEQALRPASVLLQLAPADSPEPPLAVEVAKRSVSLREGPYVLRYSLATSVIDERARSTVAIHAGFGLAALLVALFALDFLVRARLAFPLRRLAHQIRFMRSGGGWSPILPAADAEITEVNDALKELGPALHEQLQTRIEAERRAAVATVLSELRARMRDPKRRALALLSDLLAGDELTPDGKHGLRAAIAALESLSGEIDGAEVQVFGRR